MSPIKEFSGLGGEANSLNVSYILIEKSWTLEGIFIGEIVFQGESIY